MTGQLSRILVLGASGLIGRFVTDDLRRRGLAVIGVARRLSDAQRISPDDLELPIMAMDAAALAERLYLVKALVIASLALFWIASGLIALVISFPATIAILTSHGWPERFAVPFAAITSMMDISIGVLIAVRRTAGFGLIAGMLVSLGYLAGCAIFTPDLWVEPLGALVKTGPAIVLMLVALLTLDNR